MRRLTANLNRLLPLIMIFTLLMACGSPSRLTFKNTYTANEIYYDSLFGEPINVMSLDEVFALTDEQKQNFLNKFHSKEYRQLSDSQRIFEYLQDRLHHFNFHSETLIATDAMALNSGNCMSLAILTKALSQLTHVGINYELARTPAIYQREGSLELSSQHIRAVVYNKTTQSSKQFMKPNDKVKIDYFSTTGSRTLRKIKKNEFYSLFYSNLAVEAMINDNNNLAYWSIKEALKIKPDNLVAINILGVLYDQVGADAYAERAYLFGLSFKQGHLELLNNYHKFLVQAKRIPEAQMIANELENYNDPDPFKWLDIADAELKKSNYQKAIKFYKKAATLADYLHQPYAGIAKAHFALGRPEQAIKAIQQALEKTHTKQTTSIYQAKYDYFKSHQNVN